jgi:hypothetical protein
MKKLFLFILLTFFLARFGFSIDKKQKEKIQIEQYYVTQYYDITFTVYKYLAEDQLKEKELLGKNKREVLKKLITVWENKSYIKDFMIADNIRVNFKFDFNEFLILKIYINSKELIVFQNKGMDFRLNFKVAEHENYLIETAFTLGRFGSIVGGRGINIIKTTKKIKK